MTWFLVLQYAKKKQDEVEDYQRVSFPCSDTQKKHKIIEVRHLWRICKAPYLTKSMEQRP